MENIKVINRSTYMKNKAVYSKKVCKGFSDMFFDTEEKELIGVAERKGQKRARFQYFNSKSILVKKENFFKYLVLMNFKFNPQSLSIVNDVDSSKFFIIDNNRAKTKKSTKKSK